jgi:VanZ family protein
MKKWFYWLLPLTWMAVIFYSSATPYEKQDLKPFFSNYFDFSFLEPLLKNIEFTYNESIVSVEALGINGFVEFFIRKGAHLTVFFILFFLFSIAFRKTSALGEGIVIFYSIFLTIAYAVFDEIHQGFTPNRTPYFGDVIIDSLGAFLAAIFYKIISKKSKNLIKFNKRA